MIWSRKKPQIAKEGEIVNRFFEYFGKDEPSGWNKKVFTPVIHLPGYDRALESANHEIDKARTNGADGALLISHGELSTNELIKIWKSVSFDLVSKGIRFPVGVNWLDLTPIPDMMIYKAAQAGIDLIWSDATSGRNEIIEAKNLTHWDGLYCGAFAFKYQAKVSDRDLPSVLEEAFEYMDAPITSGEGTGVPINLEKARISRETAGDRPIGLASGVSIDNISSLLPYFDWFLVSSSISMDGDWYQHDPLKIKGLANVIHDWKPTI